MTFDDGAIRTALVEAARSLRAYWQQQLDKAQLERLDALAKNDEAAVAAVLFIVDPGGTERTWQERTVDTEVKVCAQATSGFLTTYVRNRVADPSGDDVLEDPKIAAARHQYMGIFVTRQAAHNNIDQHIRNAGKKPDGDTRREHWRHALAHELTHVFTHNDWMKGLRLVDDDVLDVVFEGTTEYLNRLRGNIPLAPKPMNDGYGYTALCCRLNEIWNQRMPDDFEQKGSEVRPFWGRSMCDTFFGGAAKAPPNVHSDKRLEFLMFALGQELLGEAASGGEPEAAA